jgi:hypothetical protein
MSDNEQVMNRFQTAGKDYQESLDGKDVKDSKSSKDVKDAGGIKDRRESFQAYIPAGDKERIEAAWSRVRKICVLADVEEPAKNDFYAAVLRAGYENMEAVAKQLGIREEYEQNRDVIE